ncbi:MAG: hypothetical protein BGO49_22600 [Planctomycetales bacterium 71-10]|nr:MAG: hypothetical protein BGO49_22600 [Planctomycetales bacterium 71-10]
MRRPIDLPDAVLARAAQDFFAAEWASSREAAGFRFRPGVEITSLCPAQDAATLLRLVRPTSPNWPVPGTWAWARCFA